MGLEILLYIVPFILVLGAQGIVSGAYAKYKVVENKKRLTGFDVARAILDKNGLKTILIVETEGTMSDHYDPTRKTVRLSTEVYHNATISSIAIAAHECGHVIQHKEKYIPMIIRSAIVPIVNIASKIGYVVLFIGLIASIFDLAIWGVVLLSATLVFQLITLPVEFNASKRAIKILESEDLIEKQEKSGVKSMLTAAAFTYVASLLANLLEILQLLLMAGRSRE
jgi:Zn-dependent membrane protease YugP